MFHANKLLLICQHVTVDTWLSRVSYDECFTHTRKLTIDFFRSLFTRQLTRVCHVVTWQLLNRWTDGYWRPITWYFTTGCWPITPFRHFTLGVWTFTWNGKSMGIEATLLLKYLHKLNWNTVRTIAMNPLFQKVDVKIFKWKIQWKLDGYFCCHWLIR